MAITAMNRETKAQLVLDGGIVNGKEKVFKKSFSNVKALASNEEVYGTMTSLGALQQKPVNGVLKISEVELIEA